jgi:pyridoxine/pyridoxamine 5'-phosphate oxidase
MIAPKPIERLIVESLQDEARPAYGQVATMGEHGWPQVRTVHLRYISERGTLGFNTHIKSPKWRQLLKKPFLSGCYHDEKRQVQFRWEGSAKLIDPESRGRGEQAILDRMWLLLRPDVRTAYWMDYQKKGLKGRNAAQNLDIQKRCPNFGTVLCFPKLWDIFEMDPSDYTKDVRTVYRLKNGQWRSQDVSILHGAPGI